MLSPSYKAEHLKAAFHLRYSWAGWPTRGSRFVTDPGAEFFTALDAAWRTDHLHRISLNWTSNKIQLMFSALPSVSPTLFVARVKGRLQHALRRAAMPVQFSRKVAFRGIGENLSQHVEHYIAQQVEREAFVDPRFSEMLRRFTVIDKTIALDQPTQTHSGRYWYNLHLVLVVSSRARFREERDFCKLDRFLVATARKHGYLLAARAWMPDHLHVALRGNIDESPEQIALSLMNNTAYAMGNNAIWQPGYYAGTFSEYDNRAVRCC